VGYPNAAERRRLERFPDRIPVEDLRACFALSDRDRLLVFDQRGPENRLGLAVSLSALRFLGFVPDEITSIPDEALVFVAGQVDAAAHELLAYGARAQTRSDHLGLVLTHLGWRRPDDADREQLEQWLAWRAVEHDAPATLMALAGEHLRARRIVRPAVETLTRMIASARAEAHRHVEGLLADQLGAERRGGFDGMLDGAGGRPSDLADLRGRAGRAGVRECLAQVDRYRRLVELGAVEIDVSALPPARRRALEALGRRMTAQQLRRLEPARRHPVVLVLLHALVIERGDELLDLFQKLLRLSDGRARRRVDEKRRSTARQRDDLADLGKRLSVILLECAATGELPLDRVREEIGLERLYAAAALEPGELPPIDVQQLDQLRGSYNPPAPRCACRPRRRGAEGRDERRRRAARRSAAAAWGDRAVRRRAGRARAQDVAGVGARRPGSRAAHPLRAGPVVLRARRVARRPAVSPRWAPLRRPRRVSPARRALASRPPRARRHVRAYP